jgi:hypothetical protein
LPLTSTEPSGVTDDTLYDQDNTARGLVYENLGAATTSMSRDTLSIYDSDSRPIKSRGQFKGVRNL